MQPYLLPYIGYFQLMTSVDTFVVYDNIQYTKKGWINRNRILVNDTAAYITASLSQDSDYLDIRERELSPTFDRTAMLNRLRGSYLRAPFYASAMPIATDIINYPEQNLFSYLLHSIDRMRDHLEVKTTIIPASSIAADHALRGQSRVIEICRALGADSYVNASGGRELYSHTDFLTAGINLAFIESSPFEYQQFGADFVPSLSIIDVLMFNEIDEVRDRVMNGYTVA